MSRRKLTRSRFLLAFTVILAMPGCTNRASKREAEDAVRHLLAKTAPPSLCDAPDVELAWAECEWCDDNGSKASDRKIDIRDVTMIKIDEPWKDTSAWPYIMHYPAKVSVDATCDAYGKRIRFQGITTVNLYPEDDGTWTASW